MKSPRVFKPQTDLTFHSVGLLRNQLYKALREDRSQPFCFDLSDAGHCDSAGLALLIEARKLCTRSKRSFELVGVSPETQSLFEFCGVKSVFSSEEERV